MSDLAGFWRYAYARQEIWYRRCVQGLPYPWTDDPILRTRRFCNVHRELDRGSIVLHGHLADHSTGDLEQQLLNVIFYRIFNRPELAVWVRDREEAAALAWRRAAAPVNRQKPRFSRTWMANGGDVRFPLKMRLSNAALNWDLTRIVRVSRSCSFASTYKALLDQPMIGSVLAYQVALDLAQFAWPWLSDDEYVPEPKLLRSRWGKEPYGPLARVQQLMPGATFGLALALLREMQDLELGNLDLRWADVAWSPKPRLTLADLEHTMCEYDKYLRGTGGGVYRP